ncbi:MAG: hypothetical protein CSA70_01030 [Rhodobacterales bacterium]|nr:MAG: hypothetical protein CSA70_01030 [Rhodobacterales bacterium]
MTPETSSPTLLRVRDLKPSRPTRFAIRPPASDLAALATELGLDGLRKLSFEGELVAEGKTDWRLTARLGATVVQPCVVTLAPVTTRIDENVTRRFLASLPDAVPDAVPGNEEDDGEIEMPEDDTIDQLESEIDLIRVMTEALALALPLYPRAEGAELEQSDFTAPGETAMTDEDARPFAGLSALRDKLAKDTGDGD